MNKQATTKIFALIRSKGDQALFNKTTQQMKNKWDIKNKTIGRLYAYHFTKSQRLCYRNPIFNAKQKQMKTEEQISGEHITNNRSVRKTLLCVALYPKIYHPKKT
jgi:DNA-damage-inducible protein D